MDATASPADIRRIRATLQDEIARIMADAERRVAPLRAKDERYAIAEEVLREVTQQAVLPDVEDLPAFALPRAIAAMKESTKALIQDELSASALPLSKQEVFDRLAARGHVVSDTTVGSTLSRMVGDGVLVKAEGNRYMIKPAQSAADAGEGGATR